MNPAVVPFLLTLNQAAKSDIASMIAPSNATSLPISYAVSAEMRGTWPEIVPIGNVVAILGIIFLAASVDHNVALEVAMLLIEKWRYVHLYSTPLHFRLN